MRKILSTPQERYLTLSRKQWLRLIGTTSLLAALTVIAALFFHTSTTAVVPEADLLPKNPAKMK